MTLQLEKHPPWRFAQVPGAASGLQTKAGSLLVGVIREDACSSSGWKDTRAHSTQITQPLEDGVPH